jgi:hypothetical protein
MTTEQRTEGKLQLLVLPPSPDGLALTEETIYPGQDAGPFGFEHSMLYVYFNRGPHPLELFMIDTSEVVARPSPGSAGSITDKRGQIGARIAR